MMLFYYGRSSLEEVIIHPILIAFNNMILVPQSSSCKSLDFGGFL